jgi:DNA polymerase III epsilon subunit-like protein
MSGDRSPAHAQEVYISVDIEAAGPVPGLYSMLALGACEVGRPDEAFYAELRPVTDAFVPEALQVGGLSMERLREQGRDPAEVMVAFGNWVRDRATRAGRPVFVGFNSSFDWAFVNWYFHQFLGENPFGIGGVDIKAYYMGLVGCAWSDTTSSRLPPQFRSAWPHTHNALDDARAQADIFAKLMAVRQRRVT